MELFSVKDSNIFNSFHNSPSYSVFCYLKLWWFEWLNTIFIFRKNFFESIEPNLSFYIVFGKENMLALDSFY